MTTILAPPAKLAKLRALEAEDRAEQAERARVDFPTPGALAAFLDPSTIQTPALELLDAELVAIRDHLLVMFARRDRMLELIEAGLDLQTAIEQAANEIEDAGNDRLLVSMPPQEGKSQRMTRYGNLWLLRQFPMLRIGIVSYDGDVATTWSYQIRSDIELYDGVQHPVDLGLRLLPGQKAMSRWQLVTGGGVFAIGIGGGLTSRSLDKLDIDDPVKDFKAADSLLQSSQAGEWWQSVARPRLGPWGVATEVATRWHEGDLSGRLQAKQVEDEALGLTNYDRWRVVNIPAQCEVEPDVLGREVGQYMVSARGRTVAQWEATKAATAPRFWSALFQGAPSPESGNIWLREWWRRYSEPLWSATDDGSYRLDGFTVWQSWDCAFRSTDASDYVVGQLWARKGATSYLVTQVWKRLSFTETVEAIRRLKRLFPQTTLIIIEGKANGDAVVDSLQHEIPGIYVYTPGTGDSKVARAVSGSPFLKAGNVWLPRGEAVTASARAGL